MSAWHGIFGFHESLSAPYAGLSLSVEGAGIAVLVLASIGRYLLAMRERRELQTRVIRVTPTARRWSEPLAPVKIESARPPQRPRPPLVPLNGGQVTVAQRMRKRPPLLELTERTAESYVFFMRCFGKSRLRGRSCRGYGGARAPGTREHLSQRIHPCDRNLEPPFKRQRGSSPALLCWQRWRCHLSWFRIPPPAVWSTMCLDTVGRYPQADGHLRRIRRRRCR